MEAHDVVIAQEHGSAIGARGFEQGVDRLVQQLVEGRFPRDRICDAVHRIHFADALPQHFALAHVARGFEDVRDSAVAVENGRTRRLDRDPPPVVCAEPTGHCLDGCAREHLGDPSAELEVGRVDEPEEERPDERVGVPARERLPRRGRVDDCAASVEDGDQVVRPLKGELLEGCEMHEVVARRHRRKGLALAHFTPADRMVVTVCTSFSDLETPADSLSSPRPTWAGAAAFAWSVRQ